MKLELKVLRSLRLSAKAPGKDRKIASERVRGKLSVRTKVHQFSGAIYVQERLYPQLHLGEPCYSRSRQRSMSCCDVKKVLLGYV